MKSPSAPNMLIAGIDEAGRGCLAGPVVAGAVILANTDLKGLADSKKLSPGNRNRLQAEIKEKALAWSIGVSWPNEIDRINILQATFMAMIRALANLKHKPDHVLIDGNQTIPLKISQQAIVRGDTSHPCISAASILAKTFRDRLMVGFDKKYPGYGFAGHKGYGTRKHMASIRLLGPCPIHRMTFSGVKPVILEKQPCLPMK